MKYLYLVYIEEKVLNDCSGNERTAVSDEAMAYCEKLQKAAQLLAASPRPAGGHGDNRTCPRRQDLNNRRALC